MHDKPLARRRVKTDDETLVQYRRVLPSAIRAIDNAADQARCTTAWRSVIRLANALEITLAVPILAGKGCTIDNVVQGQISGLFPRLDGLKGVLENFAAGPGGCDPATPAQFQPYPDAEFGALLDMLPALVRQEAAVFFGLGLPDFPTPPTDELAAVLASLTLRPAVSIATPKGVGRQKDPASETAHVHDPACPRLARFRKELEDVIERLRTVPFAVLRSPVRAAPPGPRLRVDLERQVAIIYLDDDPQPVESKEAAIWVQILIDAEGEWVSGTQLMKSEGPLKDVRVDRLKRQLPECIRDLIETGPGSRIPRSKL